MRFRNRPLDGTPLVSVIVPHYNQSTVLGECVDSVWAQTYPRDRADRGRRRLDRSGSGRGPRRAGGAGRREAAAPAAQRRAEQGPQPGDQGMLGSLRAAGRRRQPAVPGAVEQLVEQLSAAGEEIGFIYPNLQYFGNREDYYEAPAYNLYRLLHGNFCDTCSLIDRAGLRRWRVLQREHLPRPRGLGVRPPPRDSRSEGRTGTRTDRALPQVGLQSLRRSRARRRALRGARSGDGHLRGPPAGDQSRRDAGALARLPARCLRSRGGGGAPLATLGPDLHRPRADRPSRVSGGRPCGRPADPTGAPRARRRAGRDPRPGPVADARQPAGGDRRRRWLATRRPGLLREGAASLRDIRVPGRARLRRAAGRAEPAVPARCRTRAAGAGRPRPHDRLERRRRGTPPPRPARRSRRRPAVARAPLRRRRRQGRLAPRPRTRRRGRPGGERRAGAGCRAPAAASQGPAPSDPAADPGRESLHGPALGTHRLLGAGPLQAARPLHRPDQRRADRDGEPEPPGWLPEIRLGSIPARACRGPNGCCESAKSTSPARSESGSRQPTTARSWATSRRRRCRSGSRWRWPGTGRPGRRRWCCCPTTRCWSRST